MFIEPQSPFVWEMMGKIKFPMGKDHINNSSLKKIWAWEIIMVGVSGTFWGWGGNQLHTLRFQTEKTIRWNGSFSKQIETMPFKSIKWDTACLI